MAKPFLLPVHTPYKILAAWQYAQTQPGNEWVVEIDPDTDVPADWPIPSVADPMAWRVVVVYAPAGTLIGKSEGSTACFSARGGKPTITMREQSLDEAVDSAHHEMSHYLQWLAERGRPWYRQVSGHLRWQTAEEQRMAAEQAGKVRRHKGSGAPGRLHRKAQRQAREGLLPPHGEGYLPQALEPEASLAYRRSGEATSHLRHGLRPEEFFTNLYTAGDRIARELLDVVVAGGDVQKVARQKVLSEVNYRLGRQLGDKTLQAWEKPAYTKKKARYLGSLLEIVQERLSFYGVPPYKREWTVGGETRDRLRQADEWGRRNPEVRPPHHSYAGAFGTYATGVRRLADVSAAALKGIIDLRENFLTAAAAAAFYKDLEGKSRARLAGTEREFERLKASLSGLHQRIEREQREAVTGRQAARQAEAAKAACMVEFAEAAQERDTLRKESALLRNQVQQLRVNLEEAQRATVDLRPYPSASARKRESREREAALREQSKKGGKKRK